MSNVTRVNEKSDVSLNRSLKDEHIDVQILRRCMDVGDNKIKPQDVLNSLKKVFINKSGTTVLRRIGGILSKDIQNQNCQIEYARELYDGIKLAVCAREYVPLDGTLLGMYIWEHLSINVWEPYKIPEYIPKDILEHFGNSYEKQKPDNYKEALSEEYSKSIRGIV